uniref:Uncharacterized protein n=1 Tax=Cucumis sativus TaxID=3659 RepID=A0A0A0K4J2_CUCSA
MAWAKSREFPRRSDIERTQRILVHSGLGPRCILPRSDMTLLLKMDDDGIGKSRKCKKQIHIAKKLYAFWLEASWLSYFLRAIVLWLLSKVKIFPRSSDIEGPDAFWHEAIWLSYFLRVIPKAAWHSYFLRAIFMWLRPRAQSSTRIFLYRKNPMHSCPKQHVSPFYGRLWLRLRVESFLYSQEFPTKVLIPKEPDALWPNYFFLRAIVMWLRPRVESSPRKSRVPHAISNTKEIQARSGLDLLLSKGDYGFRRESEVPDAGSSIDATRCILAHSGFALLLSTGDCNVASTKSREFPTKVLIPKEPDALWPKAAWLSYFLRAIFMWLRPRGDYGFRRESEVPDAGSSIDATRCILAHSGFALLLSTSDFYVASAKSREFPMQFLIPKKFKPVAAWISYFLRAIMASGESQKFPTQRLRSPLFLGQLYCSFRRESRVLHTSFNIEGTRHILAWIGFALLLSTSDCNVASTKSREFPTKVLIPKEPDALWPKAAWLSYFLRAIVIGLAPLFSTGDCIGASIESREFPTKVLIPKEPDALWPKAAWLSYFLRAIVMWLRPRVESSPQKNPIHSSPKRLGSTIFYGGLYWGFYRKSRVPHAVFVPKELNEFWPKADWLPYFLRGIVLGLLSKVESSPCSFCTEGT